MPEELTHPGFIHDWKQSEATRATRSFEQYRPFIHTEGLSPDRTKLFLNFLARLYDQTGQLWEPTRCTSALSLEQEAKKILSSDEYRQWILRARRYLRSHYWLDLSAGENSPLLIVDPYGVPDRLIDMGSHQDLKHILPFFGPIELSVENTKNVYTKGVPIDDWGTRGLPPTFHP